MEGAFRPTGEFREIEYENGADKALVAAAFFDGRSGYRCCAEPEGCAEQ